MCKVELVAMREFIVKCGVKRRSGFAAIADISWTVKKRLLCARSVSIRRLILN